MADIISGQVNKTSLKCLVVDDEEIAAEGVAAFIGKLDFLEVADICSSAIEAGEILKKRHIDLMFLDINMPHLSGLEFLEALDKAPLTILTTAYSEFALEGFRLHVVDYLLKPFSFQRFSQAAQKAFDLFCSRILLQQSGQERSSEMFIRQGDAFQKIAGEDILYVEAMQNYIKLHFKDRTVVIHQTMASLEELLPGSLFFRIHRSFLVNVSHIESVARDRVFIQGKELPVSARRREELFDKVVYKKLITK